MSSHHALPDATPLIHAMMLPFCSAPRHFGARAVLRHDCRQTRSTRGEEAIAVDEIATAHCRFLFVAERCAARCRGRRARCAVRHAGVPRRREAPRQQSYPAPAAIAPYDMRQVFCHAGDFTLPCGANARIFAAPATRRQPVQSATNAAVARMVRVVVYAPTSLYASGRTSAGVQIP